MVWEKVLPLPTMALINITIEKVVAKDNKKVIELLEEIILLIGGDGEELRQEIYDKLNKAISDIKNTVN